MIFPKAYVRSRSGPKKEGLQHKISKTHEHRSRQRFISSQNNGGRTLGGGHIAPPDSRNSEIFAAKAKKCEDFCLSSSSSSSSRINGGSLAPRVALDADKCVPFPSSDGGGGGEKWRKWRMGTDFPHAAAATTFGQQNVLSLV